MRIEIPLFFFSQWKRIPFQTEATLCRSHRHRQPYTRSVLGDSRKKDGGTIQVAVPKVVPPPAEIVVVSSGGDVVDESASMKAKCDALERKGVVAMIDAEEYARRLESGDVVVIFVQFWFWIGTIFM